jgi:putative oxidoreductase
VPLISVPVPAHWIFEVQGLARIVFALVLVRHGLEQVFGYPPAFIDAPPLSFRGVLKMVALPGGILVMLGLFTRPVSFVLSLLYLAYWLVEPLPIGLLPDRALFGARGPSDPILLTAFFLMFLAASGPGAWSLDRLMHRDDTTSPDSKWAAYALGALRVVAAFLFIHHGLDKVSGPNPPDLLSLRGLAAVLELVGGPMLMAGLFTRPLAFLLSGQMAVAYFLSHAPNGFWGSFASPNQQAAVLNCFLFLLFWAAGPGAWSLDAVRRRRSGRAAPVLGAARGTQ